MKPAVYTKSMLHAFAIGAALAASGEGMSLVAIGETCALTKRQAELALGKLIAAGLVIRFVSAAKKSGRPVFLYAVAGRDGEETVDAPESEDEEDDESERRTPPPKNVAKSGENVKKTKTSESPSSCICINTNTNEINKRARKRRAFASKIRNTENTANTGTVDDALATVDLFDEQGAAIRRRLASIVWEPSLRAELIDRAVAAVKLGLSSLSEMVLSGKRAASIAREGVKRIWETFALDVKRAFDSAGFVWTATRSGAEPRPAPVFELRLGERSRVGDDSEFMPTVRRDRNGRSFVALC